MANLLPKIATNSNRLNSQNGSPRSLIGKSSLQYKNVLLPGEERQLDVYGDRFYLEFSTGEVGIRPMAELPGVENRYQAGTGLNLSESPQEISTDAQGNLIVAPAVINTFSALTIRNPHATKSVFLRLFAGFEEFIDNRLVWPSVQYQSVPVVALSAGDLDTADTGLAVLDKAGSIITDANGTQWFATARLQLICANQDASDYISIINTARTKMILPVHPLTTATLVSGGNVKVTKTATILAGIAPNGTITEIYQALSLT